MHTMLVDLHAILLLLIPVATIVGLLLARRRRPAAPQLLVAIAIAALAMIVTVGVNTHMCLEGLPRSQWIIAGLCLLSVLALVNSRPRRRLAAALLFVGMLGLSCHFTDVVHDRNWTGNPGWLGTDRAWLRSVQDAVDADVLAAESELTADSNDYPAGWLRDLPLYAAITDVVGDRVPARRVIHPVWHSWLTGLYRRTGVTQDLWYPGGPPSQGLRHLELRDRPERPTSRPDGAGT